MTENIRLTSWLGTSLTGCWIYTVSEKSNDLTSWPICKVRSNCQNEEVKKHASLQYDVSPCKAIHRHVWETVCVCVCAWVSTASPLYEAAFQAGCGSPLCTFYTVLPGNPSPLCMCVCVYMCMCVLASSGILQAFEPNVRWPPLQEQTAIHC